MATYKKVSRSIPTAQRHQAITEVEAGDEIDIVDVLGRPARGMQIVPEADTDVITLRLNNKIRMTSKYVDEGQYTFQGIDSPASTTVVSKGEHHPLYTLSGEEQYLTQDGLQISFVQIEDITGNDTCSLYVW